jgi:CrcB protein
MRGGNFGDVGLLNKLVWIAIGGGVGSVCRYLLSGWGQRLAGESFPLGTLVVNATGCLLIGLFAAAFGGALIVREEIRLAILVGVLGGFTTFSTFSLETLALINDGQFGRALANVLLSVTVCMVAVWIGYRVGERWMGV